MDIVSVRAEIQNIIHYAFIECKHWHYPLPLLHEERELGIDKVSDAKQQNRLGRVLPTTVSRS